MPRRTLTQKQFLEQAELVFGFRYDHRFSTYRLGRDPILVVCWDHGPFLVRASDHLYRNVGCPVCGAEGQRSIDCRTNVLLETALYGEAFADYLATRIAYLTDEYGIYPADAADAAADALRRLSKVARTFPQGPTKDTTKLPPKARPAWGPRQDRPPGRPQEYDEAPRIFEGASQPDDGGAYPNPPTIFETEVESKDDRPAWLD